MNAAATSALGTPTSPVTPVRVYRCEAFGGENAISPPSVAVFSIDEETAGWILGLANLVQTNDLARVCKYDRRAQFLQHDPETDPEDAALAGVENELRTEGDVLVVTADEFYFAADVEHADSSVHCAGQPISELREYFGLR
jgi:hypothetical protein